MGFHGGPCMRTLDTGRFREVWFTPITHPLHVRNVVVT